MTTIVTEGVLTPASTVSDGKRNQFHHQQKTRKQKKSIVPSLSCGDVAVQRRAPALKRAQIRHKRNPKDPNRIDDLLMIETAASNSGNDSCSSSNYNFPVLDFAQTDHEMIRDRIFRLDSSSSTSSCTAQKSNHQNDKSVDEGDVGRLYDGPLWGINGFPGFVVAPNALHQDLQKRLAWEAVTSYCEKPHRTNLDAHQQEQQQQVQQYDLTETAKADSNEGSEPTMWECWKRQQRKILGNDRDNARDNTNLFTQFQHKKARREMDIKLDFTSGLALPSIPNANQLHNQPGNLKHDDKGSLHKLAWSTCGLHYDWTERSYDRGQKSPMPRLIGKLSRLFAHTAMQFDDHNSAGQSDDQTNALQNGERINANTPPPVSKCSSFVPSAAIVNYYNTKSTMGGHRDDLEEALDKPIVSLSLGLPAIFLLGGLGKDDDDDTSNVSNGSDEGGNVSTSKPVVTAILLRPGDVLIMAGPSRLRYHAMARVLPKEAAAKLDAFTIKGVDMREKNHVDGMVNVHGRMGSSQPDADRTIVVKNPQIALNDLLDDQIGDLGPQDGIPDDDRDFLKEYLENHRININVRQVYPDDRWGDFVL